MANNLRFSPYTIVIQKLNISGDNYLSWSDEFKNYARMYGIVDAIPSAFGKDETQVLEQLKATAYTALRTHLDEGLRDLIVEDDNPNKLWEKLKSKFADVVSRRKAKIIKDWQELGVDNFPSLNHYEVALNRIIRDMKLCGYKETVDDKEKVDKTVETLGADQHALQTTLRAHGYTSFDKLMHDLREHDIKSRIVRERDLVKRRIAVGKAPATETYMTKTVPYKKEQRPGQTRGKGKPQPMSRMTRRPHNAVTAKSGARANQCFACGSRTHLFVDCNASDEQKLCYMNERIATARRKKVESHSVQTNLPDEMEDVLEHCDFVSGIESMDIDEAEAHMVDESAGSKGTMADGAMWRV